MGLDTVELVMAVEEHFEIEIPDEIAATLETVGQLHNDCGSRAAVRFLEVRRRCAQGVKDLAHGVESYACALQ